MGRSQAEFAALAGASKGAQLKWEKGESSPTASILTAWADAGADVLYILTGRRTVDRPSAIAEIEGRIASIRNDFLSPAPRSPGESEEAAAKRMAELHASELSAFLRDDDGSLQPGTRDELEHLLQVATNPAALALYQAAEFVQRRGKRREMRDRLASWLGGGPYLPKDSVGNLLATLALDYGVPITFLAELVDEIYSDIAESPATTQARKKAPT